MPSPCKRPSLASPTIFCPRSSGSSGDSGAKSYGSRVTLKLKSKRRPCTSLFGSFTSKPAPSGSALVLTTARAALAAHTIVATTAAASAAVAQEFPTISSVQVTSSALVVDELLLRRVAACRWACHLQLRQRFQTCLATIAAADTDTDTADADAGGASNFFPAVSSQPGIKSSIAAAGAPPELDCVLSAHGGTTRRKELVLLVAFCNGSPSLTQALLAPLLGPRHAASMLSTKLLSRPFKLLWNITARLQKELAAADVPAARIASPYSEETLKNHQRCCHQVLERSFLRAFAGRTPGATNTCELPREERCAFVAKLLEGVENSLNALAPNEVDEDSIDNPSTSPAQLLRELSPSKVIAGLEPERTNVLLQLLALTSYAARDCTHKFVTGDALNGKTTNAAVVPNYTGDNEGTAAVASDAIAHEVPSASFVLESSPAGATAATAAVQSTAAEQSVRCQLMEFSQQMALLQGDGAAKVPETTLPSTSASSNGKAIIRSEGTAINATDKSRSSTCGSNLSSTLSGTAAAADASSAAFFTAAAAPDRLSESPRTNHGFVQRVKGLRRQRTPPMTAHGSSNCRPPSTSITAALSAAPAPAPVAKNNTTKLALIIPSNLSLKLPSPPASSPQKLRDEINAIPKEVWYLSGLKHLSIHSNSNHHAQLVTDAAALPLLSPLQRPRLHCAPLQLSNANFASNKRVPSQLLIAAAEEASHNVKGSHNDVCDAHGAAKSTDRCRSSNISSKSNSRDGKHREAGDKREDEEDVEWAVWEQNWAKVEAWIERVRKERIRLAQQRPLQQLWHQKSGSASDSATATRRRPVSQSGTSSFSEGKECRDEHQSNHAKHAARGRSRPRSSNSGSRSNNTRDSSHSTSSKSSHGTSRSTGGRSKGSSYGRDSDSSTADPIDISSAGPLPDQPLWARIEAYEKAVQEMMAPLASEGHTQAANAHTTTDSEVPARDGPPEAPRQVPTMEWPITIEKPAGTTVTECPKAGAGVEKHHPPRRVSVKDIPWPHPLESVLGIDDNRTHSNSHHHRESLPSKRRKLRRALLFWHPDHFHRTIKFFLAQQQQEEETTSGNISSSTMSDGTSAGDREEDILNRARAVTRRIIAEKEALGL